MIPEGEFLILGKPGIQLSEGEAERSHLSGRLLAVGKAINSQHSPPVLNMLSLQGSVIGRISNLLNQCHLPVTKCSNIYPKLRTFLILLCALVFETKSLTVAEPD